MTEIRAETVPTTTDPEAWAMEKCEAHDYHAPVPRVIEYHHIIPRAWQAIWTPPEHATSAHPTMWAPETVGLCRTGHGNIHYWIERMMKAYQDSIMDAYHEATMGEVEVGRREHVIAREALERFTAAGGALTDLVAHHAWGGMYGQGEI